MQPIWDSFALLVGLQKSPEWHKTSAPNVNSSHCISRRRDADDIELITSMAILNKRHAQSKMIEVYCDESKTSFKMMINCCMQSIILLLRNDLEWNDDELAGAVIP